jgi:alpha-methylacyl-CoA racemase
VALALELLAGADVAIEGFRPGTMERLGLGPEPALSRNPRLVYGRMTGWGQDGPRAHTAGHDIDYIAITGALEPIASGPGTPPVPPMNLLGDFGGGGMLLAFGVLAALLHAQRTGQGQVVDAAIVDGTALFTAMLHSQRASGEWLGARGENIFDGGAPYYGVFETADGKWLAVGAIEPQFYREFTQRLGLSVQLPADAQDVQAGWPAARATIAAAIAGRTRAEWETIFADSDACVAPVLAPDEAVTEAHLSARSVFTTVDGVVHPAAAPRFAAHPAAIGTAAPVVGQDTRAVLAQLGRTPAEIDELLASGAAGAA